MQLEEEIKQLKEENLQLKEQLNRLYKLYYITDEALDVVLTKMDLTVNNTTITDIYELKTVPQTSKSTVRYYCKSEYLLSAPEELKAELELEFNRLMNLRPKKSFKEVQQELKNYKDMLLAEEELSAPTEVLAENSLIAVHELD